MVEQKKRVLKFRSYQPSDGSVPAAVPPLSAAAAADAPAAAIPATSKAAGPGPQVTSLKRNRAWLKQELQTTAERGASAADATTATSTSNLVDADGRVNFAAVAPKKVNWDLKRDLAPKLQQLDDMTQEAIVDIVREKVENESSGSEDEEGDSSSSDDESAA